MATTKLAKPKKRTAAQEIALRNKKFKAATPAQKRVLIAKDVIAQIKAKRFKALSGTWVNPVFRNGHDLDVFEKFVFEKLDEEPASVRELFLEQKIPACECCALGAMFMSCTLYNNKTTVENLLDETVSFEDLIREKGPQFSNGLDQFFSKAQLKLIEATFEGYYGAFRDESNDKTRVWYETLPNDTKRLVAIMNNIIKNKGVFKP
jgi:hypothetical protein